MKIYTETEREIAEQLRDFLQSHPLISLNALERVLEIPQSTLSKSISGVMELPVKHHWRLILELSKYGFQLWGFALSVDEFGHIYGRKFKEGKDTVEVKHPSGGTSFEYIIVEDRIMATEYLDLL